MAKAQRARRAAASPVLPPIYRPLPLATTIDAFAAACDLAAAGDAEASFAWAARDDVAECAVALAPDRPLAEARLAIYAAMVAAGDALGALVPPAVAVAFAWPDRLLINGAFAGGCRFAADAVAEDAEPSWAVVGLTLRVTPEPGLADPGTVLDRTSLFDEGCGDVTVEMIVESFARHFLYWVNRWQEDGFGAVLASWLARASGRDTPVSFVSGDARVVGRAFAFDLTGGLMVKCDHGRMVKLPLAEALDTTDWEVS